MSEYGNSKQRPLYVYILLALAGIGASALLGYWAGGLAGGFSSQDILTGAEETPPGAEEAALEAPEPVVWPQPPVYVCLGPGAPAALRAISAGEIDGFLLRESPSEAQLTEPTRAKGMRVEQLHRPA